MTCWVDGCDGQHDEYLHPEHNCKPPHAATQRPGRVWSCPDCTTPWRRTPRPRHPGAAGWELV